MGSESSEVILTGTFIARHDVQSFYDMFKQTGAAIVSSRDVAPSSAQNVVTLRHIDVNP